MREEISRRRKRHPFILGLWAVIQGTSIMIGRILLHAARVAAIATANAARVTAQVTATAGRASMRSVASGTSRMSSLFSRGGVMGTRAGTGTSQSFEVLARGSHTSLSSINASPQAVEIARRSVWQALKGIAAEYKKTIISSSLSAVIFSGISVGIGAATGQFSGGNSQLEQISEQVNNNTELLGEIINNHTAMVADLSNNNTLFLAKAGVDNALGLNEVMNNNTYYLEDAVKRTALTADEVSHIFDQAFEDGIKELEETLGPEFIDLGYLRYDELKMLIKHQIDQDFLHQLMTRLKVKGEEERRLADELQERKGDPSSSSMLIERLDNAVLNAQEEKRMIESLISTNIDEDIKHRLAWEGKEKEIRYRLAKEMERKKLDVEKGERERLAEEELRERYELAEKKERKKLENKPEMTKKIKGTHITNTSADDEIQKITIKKKGTEEERENDEYDEYEIFNFSLDHKIWNGSVQNDQTAETENVSQEDGAEEEAEKEAYDEYEEFQQEKKLGGVVQEDSDYEIIENDSKFYCIETAEGMPVCELIPLVQSISKNCARTLAESSYVWLLIVFSHVYVFL